MPSAPAQITFTSNVFASPEFVADVVTVIMLVAGHFGVHVLADPLMQQVLVIAVGRGLAWVGHYLFPDASGKLGLTASMPWNTPAAKDIPVGTSVVAVSAPQDAQQATAVVPLDQGAHRVEVTAPIPVIPVALPPTVTVTRTV